MRACLFVVVCGLVMLAGCSGGSFSGNQVEGLQAPGVAGAKLTGAVHGGQNPISGAHVYLLAAASGASGVGAAAYGGSGIAASASNASVSLLTKGSGQDGSGNYYVATGSDGSFSISGDYTCAAGQQVYLYTVGGDPGMGTGANPAAGLMAALGNCPSLGTFPSGMFVIVNEVSTVAAAYAMAGFATDATHVGSSGTALAQVGIANAFLNAANLADLPSGTALATTPAGNGAVPQAEINTLANILAACVNSNGAGSACTTLFANAQSGGTTGTAATDTATAAINIAHNPAAGIAALYGLASGTPPFTPGLSAQPNDWTVGLNFTGGGVASPLQLAVDGSGAVWVANRAGSGSVTEMSSSGAFLSGTTGYTGAGLGESSCIAIDGSGHVWLGMVVSNSLTELSSSGAILSGTNGYTGGGLSGPEAIAIDGFGNVWTASFAGPLKSVSKFSNSGSPLSGSGYTGGGINSPISIAIDGSGNAWVGNFGGDRVTKLSNNGSILSGTSGYATGGTNPTTGTDGGAMALDSGGNVWLANYEYPFADMLFNTGSINPGTSSLLSGGLGRSMGVAIDGAGIAWFTNQLTNTVTELNSAGVLLSGINGYSSGGTTPQGIAIDGSGGAWIANSAGNSVTELVGVATPVITPIVAGLPATPTADGSSNLGTRP